MWGNYSWLVTSITVLGQLHKYLLESFDSYCLWYSTKKRRVSIHLQNIGPICNYLQYNQVTLFKYRKYRSHHPSPKLFVVICYNSHMHNLMINSYNYNITSVYMRTYLHILFTISCRTRTWHNEPIHWLLNVLE